MSNTEIANTILSQLGGRRFIVMTGAKDFVAIDNGIKMTLPRGMKNKANRLTITLTDMDTYNMEFGRYVPSSFSYKEINTVEGVYCDMLQEIFTNETGFYTKM
jgi:hypothetical protein